MLTNMEERNAFDILIDYPKKHGLPYDTHMDYRRFYLFPNDPILNTRFVIFKTDPVFFYAYDSYAAKANMTKTYSGIYKPIKLKENIELKIYKKDWLDKYLRANKRKSGVKHVDNFVTITSYTKHLSFYLSKEAVSLFLALNKLFCPFQLIIQNDHHLNISELKSQKVIGIETLQWLYKEEDLDNFIHLGKELIDNIAITNA